MTDTTTRAESPEMNEDVGLVRKAAAGDAAAFEALFEKYRDAIYNVAWRYVSNRETAMDLAQDAFVRAYEKLATFRSESNFYTWLRRIVANLAIDHLRSKASQTASFDEDVHGEGSVRPGAAGHEPQPIRRAEQKEFTSALHKALEKLSNKHRTVFVLHAVEEMSYKEIAGAVDCSLGTVMSRLHYARKHLQELMHEHFE